MDKSKLKQYTEVNRIHAKYSANSTQSALAKVFLVCSAALQALNIALCIGRYGTGTLDWYFPLVTVIGMLIFYRSQSKAFEQGQYNNYFDKFMYVPVDYEAMLKVKCMTIVKQNVIYMVFIIVTGFIWRAGVNMQAELLIKQRVPELSKFVMDYLDINILVLVQCVAVVLAGTVFCILTVVWDYKKSRG